MSSFNLEKEIECKCGEIMEESNFSIHFKKCPEFKKYYRKFDESFSLLLKNFSEPKENLLVIRFLLKQYIIVLGKKIKGHFIEITDALSKASKNKENKKRNSVDVNQIENSLKNKNENDENKKNDKNDLKENENLINDNDYARPFTIEANQVKKNKSNKLNNKGDTCMICGDVNILYLECFHCICKKCFLKLADEDLPNMFCQNCKKENKKDILVSEKDKKDILGDKKYDDIYNKFNLLLYGTIVECPKCHEKNSFEKGDVDYNIKDENNKKLSKQACEDYANNRCRCPNCQTVFCISCNLVPYHLGKTCKEYKDFINSKKCRYDNTVITSKTKSQNGDICSNKECLEKYKISCKKKLTCGHVCWGCKYEKKCPPCLDSKCKGYKNYFDQDIDSYCNICFIEGLGNAPVVLFSCNHYIHFKCIEMRLKKKWNGPKITFNHCLCPLCNKWLNCPNVPEIQELIDWNKKLYDKISKMALERLKFEGLDKDKRLTDKNSKWYNNELQYALNRITYYMCYQCKEPYFAGLRECGDGPLINNNDPNKDYDPKDCVCGKHANIYGVAGVSDCKIHGKEFIEYKCRFCCKIASWFCWGTTHFCDECHARQCKGDYISKYPKEALPKHDPKTCQIKVPHPPNGEEFALGCRVCRIEKNNVKNF